MIIWFTGLSGSGKFTLSDFLKQALEKVGFSVCQVDGDIFRQKEKKEKHFSRQDIIENNLKIISHCQAFENDYDFMIVAVISPYQETRDVARKTFGKNYFEIFLNCPLEVVIKNDVKGIYKKAQSGEIKDLIGFSLESPYEIPQNRDLEIKTDKLSVGESVNMILENLQKNYGIKI